MELRRPKAMKLVEPSTPEKTPRRRQAKASPKKRRVSKPEPTPAPKPSTALGDHRYHPYERPQQIRRCSSQESLFCLSDDLTVLPDEEDSTELESARTEVAFQPWSREGVSRVLVLRHLQSPNCTCRALWISIPSAP